jgi:hypothetical protein
MLLLACLAVSMSACTILMPSDFRTFEQYAEPTGQFRDTPLASGQIVVSGSASHVDIALALIPQEFSPYIHMGILVIEDGVPYVYEELGNPSMNLDPEIPPTATIEGAVTRNRLDKFARRYYYIEIYEPANADREKVAEFARHHYAVQTPFDKYFDYSDDSAFYCSEFVARALEAGGSDALSLTPNRPNRSFSVLMDWLRTPETSLDAQRMVDASQPVMLISNRSKTEILTLNEVKRELHRRFTSDQMIGNVFRWRLQQPVLRFPVEDFVRRSMRRTDGLPAEQEQIAAVVRQMADELFGPFPPRSSTAHEN